MRGLSTSLSPTRGAITLAALSIVVLTAFGVVRAGFGSLAATAFDVAPTSGSLLMGLVCGAPPRLSGTLGGVVPWCAFAGVLGSTAAWALALAIAPRRLGSPWLAKLRLLATAVALATLSPWIAAAFVSPGFSHEGFGPFGVAAWLMGLVSLGVGMTIVGLIALRRIDVLEDIERPLPTILGSRFLHVTLFAAILLFFAGAAYLRRLPPEPPAAAQQLGAVAAAEEAHLKTTPSRPHDQESPSETPPL